MREVLVQQVSLGANGGLRLRPCPIGPSGYKYIWRAAMSVRWDEHDADLYVAYAGGAPDITLVEDFRLIVSAVASEHGDRLVLSPSTAFVGVPSEVVALLRGMPRLDSLNSFHEKAGMSQESFFFPSCGFLTFEPGRPVAILPSALLVERFSLGAWWAFLIQ